MLALLLEKGELTGKMRLRRDVFFNTEQNKTFSLKCPVQVPSVLRREYSLSCHPQGLEICILRAATAPPHFPFSHYQQQKHVLSCPPPSILQPIACPPTGDAAPLSVPQSLPMESQNVLQYLGSAPSPLRSRPVPSTPVSNLILFCQQISMILGQDSHIQHLKYPSPGRVRTG